MLEKVCAFARRVALASGWASPANGGPSSNVGIGGSDLGPVMAYEAHEAVQEGLGAISNIPRPTKRGRDHEDLDPRARKPS